MAEANLGGKLKTVLVGKSRDLSDRSIFHKLSLIAFFAWVGLGADGLSSSCYGPEETFKALNGHIYLSLLVAAATMATVFIISASYSQIIEYFPTGGGGYLVASKLLSPTLGVVSGSALLIDYVLTITLSVASGADALFSLLPPNLLHFKLGFEALGVCVLTLLNLRGAKEAVLPWVPIFLAFVLTHLFAIGYTLLSHLSNFSAVWQGLAADVSASHHDLGWVGMGLLVLRAYSMGAGTYTGIEAVSNGLPILREPRVQTGKRTMRYMAISLALTVGGLLVGYLLYRVQPVAGKTLNAVLFEQMTARWPHGVALTFIVVTLGAEAALLFVAAQTGFLDGPRVLSNMALDRWLPSRFATLSDRFVTHNGITLMGAFALVLMLASHGSVDFLVVLYSINVFITFTLSQLGMVRHWWQARHTEPGWQKKLAVNGVGAVLTIFILVSLSFIKFFEGGWITLVVTGLLVGTAFLVKRHYNQTSQELRHLDDLVSVVQLERQATGQEPAPPPAEPDLKAKTAVVLVNGFNGLGLHTLFGVLRMFPGVFKNFVFVQIGVVDAGNFKGIAEVENLKRHIEEDNQRYVDYLRSRGFYAEAVTEVGIDVVQKAVELAPGILQRFPNAIFFGGQLVFHKETFFTRFLHNYAVFALQRRFYQQGLPLLILPIRV
ncbi:Amino acid transporter [Verrucomicrobia bacterium]|nr:Amino acid transporter [Verrucomicrobiota bacterium]